MARKIKSMDNFHMCLGNRGNKSLWSLLKCFPASWRQAAAFAEFHTCGSLLFPGEPPFCSRTQVRTRPALGFELGGFGPPGQQCAWAPVSSSCLNCVEVDHLMFMCWAESRPITVWKLFYRAHGRKFVSTEMVVEGFLLPLLELTDTTLLKFYLANLAKALSSNFMIQSQQKWNLCPYFVNMSLASVI